MENSAINPAGAGPISDASGHLKLSGQEAQPGFKEMLKERLDEVNALQLEADAAVRDLVAGKTDNLHEVLVAVSEADLSFRLMMQVRNKLVDAYKEIMRMQV